MTDAALNSKAAGRLGDLHPAASTLGLRSRNVLASGAEFHGYDGMVTVFVDFVVCWLSFANATAFRRQALHLAAVVEGLSRQERHRVPFVVDRQ